MPKRRKTRLGYFFKKFSLTNDFIELYDVLAINNQTGSIVSLGKVSNNEDAKDLKQKYLTPNTKYYMLEDSSALVEF